MRERFEEFKLILNKLGYDVYLDSSVIFDNEEDILEVMPVIIELNKLGVKTTVRCSNIMNLYIICATILSNPITIKFRDVYYVNNWMLDASDLLSNSSKYTQQYTINYLWQLDKYIRSFEYDKVTDLNSLAKCIANQLIGRELKFSSNNISKTVKMFKLDCYVKKVCDLSNYQISYLVDGDSKRAVGYRLKYNGVIRDIDIQQVIREKAEFIGVHSCIKCQLVNGVYMTDTEVQRGIKIKSMSLDELKDFIRVI